MKKDTVNQLVGFILAIIFLMILVWAISKAWKWGQN